MADHDPELAEDAPLRSWVWWGLWQHFETVLIVWFVVLLGLFPFLLALIYL